MTQFPGSGVRARGVAALALTAAAGLLGTYVGSPRTARAYAAPGAPFEAFFTGNNEDAAAVLEARLPNRSRSRARAMAPTTAPTCTISVDDSVALHSAVVGGVASGSTICITDDILDLSTSLVIDDTTLTLVGAAGDDSLTSITLNAVGTRHVEASFTSPNSRLTIRNMTLTGGDAYAGPAPSAGDYSQNGGSIYISGHNGWLQLEDDTFVGNTAWAGGAVFSNEARMYAIDSRFTGNESYYYGGAVLIVDARLDADGASFDSNNSVIGGAIGAIADDTAINATMFATTFTNNSADDSGGAVAALGRLKDANIVAYGTPDDPSVFDGNSAGTGGAIYAAGRSGNGAHVWGINGVTFSDNHALTGSGGAVHVVTDDPSPSLYYAAVAFGSNSAVSRGGVVFTDDSAAVAGGAVASNGLAFFGLPGLLSGPTLSNNSANDAGAVYSNGGLVTYTATFTDNRAVGGSGGAVAHADAPAGWLSDSYIMYSYLEGNSAGRLGGAVAAGGTSLLQIYNSTLANNDAVDGGGGIATYGMTLIAQNSTFTGNSSAAGGAAHLTGTTGGFSFSTITANSADDTGGGVYTVNSVGFENAIVAGNTAPVRADVMAAASIYASYTQFTSAGTYSTLSGASTGVITGAPGLAALADNGGPLLGDGRAVPTMALQEGAVGINAADPDPTLFPHYDERGVGFPRVIDGRADVGAFERTPPPPPPPPPTPAGPPLGVTATAGDASATVSWQPPTSSGSFAVTDYRAVASPGGQSCLVTSPATSCTVTGLTNGVVYTFTVEALTGAGWGQASEPSEPVTPEPIIAKTIVISGSRESISGRSYAVVEGSTTGMHGDTVQARVKLRGQTAYSNGSTRVVDAAGAFTWQRRNGKKTYVYFISADGSVRSNRVVIDS